MPGPRRTRLRDGWRAEDAKRAGADFAKLLWFYRPDGDATVAEQQRQLIRDLVATCAAVSLPLVVEPIWYPLPGEDPDSSRWRAARVDGILASAFEANALGVTGIPTFVFGDLKQRALAVVGCQPYEVLAGAIRRLQGTA